MKDYKILIVDDEEDLCEILQFNLEGEGYKTEIACSAEEALRRDLQSFDLILLDVMMGEMSGFKLAQVLRKEKNLTTPIIFITAKTAEDDLLTGFSLGGDDYITKPFSLKEVLVRVKAVLKRNLAGEPAKESDISFDELVLNLNNKKLKIRGKEVELTRKEFEMLVLLIRQDGYILSREEILERIWEENTIVNSRTIDVHMARLRKKLGDYGICIRNKPGYGYIFEKPIK